ncbi:CsbD family protein [Streptococcus mitis]|uniref:CsbD family protein n=1 Tax=Streptococcus mitis TaxID=28037 RepID=A0A7X1RMM4_STRMT|nr:CsbD family protein [Streptococcus mitis]MQQ51856.1 CsbD family protein [Streptococcus mitis]
MSTEEKLTQAAGSVKEGVGKLIGDKELENEGAAEKVVSKVKEVAEDAKDAVEGVVEGVKNMLHKDEEK